MNTLTIEIERTIDRRAADDRIRHLEAQIDALRGLIALLERKLGERIGGEGVFNEKVLLGVLVDYCPPRLPLLTGEEGVGDPSASLVNVGAIGILPGGGLDDLCQPVAEVGAAHRFFSGRFFGAFSVFRAMRAK